jgi:hypothetical protein
MRAPCPPRVGARRSMRCSMFTYAEPRKRELLMLRPVDCVRFGKCRNVAHRPQSTPNLLLHRRLCISPHPEHHILLCSALSFCRQRPMVAACYCQAGITSEFRRLLRSVCCAL